MPLRAVLDELRRQQCSEAEWMTGAGVEGDAGVLFVRYGCTVHSSEIVNLVISEGSM